MSGKHNNSVNKLHNKYNLYHIREMRPIRNHIKTIHRISYEHSASDSDGLGHGGWNKCEAIRKIDAVVGLLMLRDGKNRHRKNKKPQ